MASNEETFTPRDYQIDLYEKAVTNNTILYLPTGAGKTYIAVMLIKKLSGSIQKSYAQGGKRTIFLVCTVPLVTQQCEYIARHTGLLCKGYSGDMQVDFWKEKEWLQELEETQVLVMTCQILLDALCHGFLHLNKINLLIFDECHRAVNEHPMRQIMQRFEDCPIEEQPRVLAMSGSLLNSNVKLLNIDSVIQGLETTFHAKIATVKAEDCIKDCSTNSADKLVLYKQNELPLIWNDINNMLENVTNVLKYVSLSKFTCNNETSTEFQPDSKNVKLNRIIQDIKEHFSITGIYGGNIGVLLHLIQLECLKQGTEERETRYIIEYIITQLIKIRKMLDDIMIDYNDLERITKFSSDKVLKLISLLKMYHDSTESDHKFCCIIFVKRRFTAKILYHILKARCNLDSDYEFLRPDFVVGNSNNPYKNSREAMCISKWNKEVIQKFRNGLSNCIAATDVVDEGIDVPVCTLVVRFDPPMDFRSYIQSKGRARYKNSSYVILLDPSNTNFASRYKDFQLTESYMKQILIGKSDLRKEPTQEQIQTELYQYQIPPYIVKHANGQQSTLTEHSAISLVNHYCASIYQSKFLHVTPIWKLNKFNTPDENKFQVSVKLPIISSLRATIEGDCMPSITSAKRSAAMKICIELHKIGELTDHLLPHTAKTIAQNVDYLFPHWVEEEIHDAMPGTYKKKRWHKLQHPQALYSAFPVEGEPLYLHILYTKPMYSVPQDNRHLMFHKLLCDISGFAILSTKQMPQIPSFPLFMNVGKLHVDMKVNHEVITLIKSEIDALTMFHTVIFNEILSVIKPFMTFDRYNLDNCFLIVPTDKENKINWEVVQKYQSIKRIPPSVPVQNTNEYELALVTPSYREAPSVYVVTQVCDDLSPEACFPTDDFYSYAHYYKQRHDITIRDMQQPLLEVKPISKKIQYIKPRNMKLGLSKRKKADMLDDFEEHLVPELCHKVQFPALYWLKATTLPSILHRVSQLLIADDLRRTIASEIRVGIVDLLPVQKWSPFTIAEREEEEEEENQIEALMETTVDDVVEVSQAGPNLNGPEIDVLNLEDSLYPWSKEEEPSDLERNIDQIQLIDVNYYYEFMSKEDVGMICKTKNIKYASKPNVPIPPLKIIQTDCANSVGPDPVEIMQALTSTLGNDVVNFERLETLGDSYLKFITSLYLYTCFPTYTEGHLTVVKGKIIGNRNLYYCGTNKLIPGRMKVDDFIPNSNFIPPAYTTYRPLQKILVDSEVCSNVLFELQIPIKEQISGEISNTTMNSLKEKVINWDSTKLQTGMEHCLGVQIVSDKTVADSVEALIGVYLKNMGLEVACKLLMWFEILPSTINIHDLLHNVTHSSQIGEGDPNVHMPWASALETKLDYKFQDRSFLLQAFTHPSYIANGITECYQRLEFLGDAILDFLLTCYIYENCGELSPGDLTDLRSALVNNITFACLAVKYGLHTALLAYAPKLNDAIDRFVKFQEKRNHLIDDQLLYILLDEEECHMAEYIDVPKGLGDIFESLIGAIYLDTNKNLQKVWEIIYALMHHEIKTFSNSVPKQPIRLIYETQGAHPNFLDASIITDTATVMVPLEVTIEGKSKTFYGFGVNKKQAKCAAAKHALKYLLPKK